MMKLSSIYSLPKSKNPLINFKSFYFGNGTFKSFYFGSGNIATWSPLATAFNTKVSRKPNLSFTKKDRGLFKIPQLVESSGFYLLNDYVFERTDKLMNEVYSKDRSRKMVDIFDELSDTLCRVADMAEFIRSIHPKADYTQAATHVCGKISALVEKLNTDRRLYDALKTVGVNGDIMPLDEVDKRVTDLFLFDFEQSGIHLDEEKRKRVVALNESILQTGSFFVQNCQKPTLFPKNKLPPTLKNAFPAQNEFVMVSGFHADSNSEKARELAYKIYLSEDSHQEELFQSLLKSRHELAQLCGFPTYSHRTLRNSFAKEPSVVKNFLDRLSEIVREPAAKNYDEMFKAKRSNFMSSSATLKPWDVPYFSSFIKNEKYRIHALDYQPYFSLGACMDGLNNILTSLFDVYLKNVETEPGEVWHPEVYKLAVTHRNEGLLGYIYCDFFERSGKPQQDCHFTIQGGRQLSETNYQMPIVVLLLNFPQPSNSTPSLLTPPMMENLFHEMGHAMHSMLGRTRHQHITGTRCSTDFAEIPSLLMEYFANDPRVLSKFCRHYKTGDPIPVDMLNRLCDSKRLFNASETQLQIFYAALDQVYHTEPLSNSTTTEILAKTQEKYYGLPYVPKTAWQLRFSHLVGYGAKYYSYLMARAVASLIWQQCFKNDPFNPDMGEKYRLEVLAHGGGKSPKELIEGFLGREATPDLLTKALESEIDNFDLK